ncbi:SDR family NAD(P)-dependent oxidoreductase [Sphingobium sp. HWE2-09]|uniref:SDR family NAD(P)-dependent oxidoreductase n=1 Tax=Sphingobium sp. HWE2-09 TaxID=3108390 RepID=UPI002DC7921F|nr:SDR family NAD(P)-dependent oxidoreductase [Sphingobium sp. HWE2-09]
MAEIASITTTGRLAGKRVLITGTGGGQGAAVQRAFSMEGAITVGCDRMAGTAEASAETLRTEGFEAVGLTVDLSDSGKAREWVDWGVAQMGGLDVVYHNAAATEFAPFDEMTRELWDFTIRNEVDMVFDVIHPAWRHLQERGGSIITIGSVAGLSADANLGQSAHMAAKGAVIALTKQLAAEGGAHRIRVNCISPGVILTPALDDLPESMKTYFSDRTYLGRLGTVADIVPAAIYLASDESSYMTGANLVIDGGLTTGTSRTRENGGVSVVQESA